MRAVEILATDVAAGQRDDDEIGAFRVPNLPAIRGLLLIKQERELGVHLVTIAALLRVVDDRADKGLLGGRLPGCFVYFDETNRPQTIRQACNKIIHSLQVRRRGASDPTSGHPLPSALLSNSAIEPKTTIFDLYGKKGDSQWHAELDVALFLEAAACVCKAIEILEVAQKSERIKFGLTMNDWGTLPEMIHALFRKSFPES